jgi:sodium pump decarboxylase gamma subunit
MILATDWTAAWLMTGVGVGVVFAILVILVLVLQIFDAVVGSSGVKPLAAKSAAGTVAQPKPLAAASDAEKAAVATAVYLYFNNIHDEESGKLTIHLNEHTGWHAVLNHSI